jgi:hypothetical protein
VLGELDGTCEWLWVVVTAKHVPWTSANIHTLTPFSSMLSVACGSPQVYHPPSPTSHSMRHLLRTHSLHNPGCWLAQPGTAHAPSHTLHTTAYVYEPILSICTKSFSTTELGRGTKAFGLEEMPLGLPGTDTPLNTVQQFQEQCSIAKVNMNRSAMCCQLLVHARKHGSVRHDAHPYVLDPPFPCLVTLARVLH